jgi:cytosine/adenosine deaminase-related metal-dependent hydrolase
MILLKNIFHLVTANDKFDRLTGVDVLISGKNIAKVGEDIEAPDSCEIIDCSTMLVLPGFVNTHHHLYQTLQRNLPGTQGLKLFDWLKTLYEIWSNLNPEAVYWSTMLGCAELLLTGCTTTNDHLYVYPEDIEADLLQITVEAAREIGIRFHPTRGSMSLGEESGGLPPSKVVQDEDEILDDAESAIKKFNDPKAFAMTRVALAPCSPFSVSPELMQKTAELARAYNVFLHTHIAETEDENEYCVEKFGKRPLELMESVGWLGPDVWFAHGVFFNDDEIEKLAQTGTKIAHCPTSNMRLGSGVARVPEMLKSGVAVGLAVDGSASNDSSDMLGELRNCMLVHKLTHGPDSITAAQIANMATRGGAEVLGRSDLGQVEEGYAADLIGIDLSRLDYAGAVSDPLAAIVFSGFCHRVDLNIVNGEPKVREGRLVEFDERDIAAKANRAAHTMLEDSGFTLPWGDLVERLRDPKD